MAQAVSRRPLTAEARVRLISIRFIGLGLFKLLRYVNKSGLEILYIVFVLNVDGVRLCLWTAASNGPIVYPAGDIWIWRGRWNDIDRDNPRNLRKTCRMPLCPQISHRLTRSSALRDWQLTTRAMAWLCLCLYYALITVCCRTYK
jgi:hypothetical protein